MTYQELLSSGFDAAAYLAANPDLQPFFNGLAKDGQGNAIMPDGEHLSSEQFAAYHYANFGKAEGRQATFKDSTTPPPATTPPPTAAPPPAVPIVSSGFDAAGYYKANPDVKASFDGLTKDAQGRALLPTGDALTADQYAEYHYNNFGKAEGRKATFTPATTSGPGTVTGFIPQYLEQHPELVNSYLSDSKLQTQYGSLAKYALAYLNSNGTVADKNAAANADATLTDEVLFPSLGYESTGGPLTTSSIEQALLQRLAPGLFNQLGGDTANNALADLLSKQAQTNYGNLADALKPALATVNPDGSMSSPLFQAQSQNADATTATLIAAAKQANASQAGALTDSIDAQKQALAAQIAALQGDASQAATDKKAALQDQIAALTAAAAPLAAARLGAAEGQVTGINQGLESTKDQIAADAAKAGYIGGSTMQDASLARATIDARQKAAQAIGDAKVANAGDTANIGYLGANTGYSIADALASQKQTIGDQGATGDAALSAALAQGNYSLAAALAQQIQGAQGQGAAAKATYFDQMFPNSVTAAQGLAQIPGAEANTLTSITPLRTTNTKNVLDILNWWATPTTTPTTSTTTIQQPSTAGNSISQLGNGLLGSAFTIGNANNWWQQPAYTAGTGGLSATSPAYGSLICWVAQEIYGPRSVSWRRFRDWMLTKAPADLQALYLRAGAKLAVWLRANGTPETRASIRRFMDRQLQVA